MVGQAYNSPYYITKTGRQIEVQTTVGTLFTDDFGGTALDLSKWIALPGGAAGIGSGTNVAMAYSVASSGLIVTLGTTAGDELWFLSVPNFSGAEDVMHLMQKSQALVANSIFVGLVEVDDDGNPIANPNLAGDFQNRGGAEFGGTVTTTAYHCEAVADASPSVAIGATGIASAWTIAQEVYSEFHAEDIITSTALVDNAAGKVAGASRVSSQCPNDNRQYKLILKFRNVTAPATSTTVTIGRVLVVAGFENRVEITSGRGDQIAQKAIATNIINAPVISTTVTSAATAGAATFHHLISAASTNGTLVKTGSTSVNSAIFSNNGAAAAYVKLYNKATSAPTVGTDTPVATILVPAGNTVVYNCGSTGVRFPLGCGYGISTGIAVADTTAVAAAQVSVHFVYT